MSSGGLSMKTDVQRGYYYEADGLEWDGRIEMGRSQRSILRKVDSSGSGFKTQESR